MANPLFKKRCPHDPNCTLKKPPEWFKSRFVKDIETGKDTCFPLDPNLSKHCTCGNNPLDAEDFVRMRLPRQFWKASLGKVTEGVREQVSNYARKIQEAKDRAISLYICGSSGVGKSGIGVVLLKEARAWGYTAYCTNTTDLRAAVTARDEFDAEGPVMNWCRSVDFLLLDDLQKADASQNYGSLSISDIRNLVVSRHDRGLVTFVTSQIGLREWESLHEPMINALEKSCVILTVTGSNRHSENQEDKTDIFSK